MLHLVGETIDKHRAQYGVETNRLIPIMRGIYVDAAAADPDEVLFQHALRIAQYLYPNTYLSGASAERLSPMPDGRLFLAGKRNDRNRIRSIEIIQARAPNSPETENVTVSDPLGEFSILRSSLPFRFLESFRSRSVSGAAVDIPTQAGMAERLVELIGAQEDTLIQLWRLAQANGWTTEAGKAETFIKSPLREAKQQDIKLHVGWHGSDIGVLTHDGANWRWKANETVRPSPVRAGAPGRLPPLLESLLPEGWLENVLKPRSERERLTSGKRYMSNIIVSDDLADLTTLPEDLLEGRLETFNKNGMFSGVYEGPAPSFDDTLEERLAGLFAEAKTPRLSGVQIKAPMHLRSSGVLEPATNRAFTHILKPAPGAGFEFLPQVEAACLDAARACGLTAADHVLVEMPGDLPPALLVERFDIRRGKTDRRRLAMEDMASIRGVPASEKYDGSIEQVARAMRGVSTDPDADILTLLLRTVFAWLTADGDLHLKNMAMLKIAPDGAAGFSSVRFSPTYDAVTTRVFPNLENDQMALAIGGKRHRLTKADFVRAATTMAIPAQLAERSIVEMAAKLIAHVDRLDAPNTKVQQAAQLWADRSAAIAG